MSIHLYYILDDDHHVIPVTAEEWEIWFRENKQWVGFTDFTDKLWVSTMFIGLNHQFDENGPPLVFETLVRGGPLDGTGRRYSSWDDAEVGHKMFVKKVREVMG